MYVCVYACMYVCVLLCMYVCVCVCVCIIYVYYYVCMYIYHGHHHTWIPTGAGGIHYEFLHNKAFISDKLYADILEKCGASFKLPGKPAYTPACETLLAKASKDAGDFYVYDVYDTCGNDLLSLDEQMAAYGKDHGQSNPNPSTKP